MAAIGYAIRFVLFAAAAAVAWLSFRSNAAFWEHTFADNAELRAFYVTLSVAAGVLKYAIAVYAEFYGFKLRHARPLLAVFLVALTFDLLSGIGYARTSRSEISAAAAQIAERRASLTAKIAEAETKRKQIPAGRVAARVQVELNAQAALGSCEARRDASTDRCRALARLKAELADAKELETVTAKIEGWRTELENLAPAKEADPQAAALAGILAPLVSAIAGPAATDAAAKWTLAILLVLLMELVPVSCARAAFAPRELPAPPPAPPARPVPKIIPAPQPANNDPAGGMVWQPCAPAPPPAAPRPARAHRPGFDLLAAIRQADAGGPCAPWLRRSADGWLYLSQADAASAAGVSKPTIGRRLKSLEAEGVIHLAVTNTGTGIKLLHPAKSAA